MAHTSGCRKLKEGSSHETLCRTGPVDGIPDTSISGRRVARELTALIERRGRPGMIVSDNGTELTSNAILKWCAEHGRECQIFSTTGAGSHSPDLTSRHPSNPQPFPLFGYRRIAA